MMATATPIIPLRSIGRERTNNDLLEQKIVHPRSRHTRGAHEVRSISCHSGKRLLRFLIRVRLWRLRCPRPRRHGVIALPAPRMTPADTPGTHPRAAENAVRLDGLKKIPRTRRLIAATRVWSDKKRKKRRQDQLVAADQDTDQDEHGATSLTIPLLRANCHHSVCNC